MVSPRFFYKGEVYLVDNRSIGRVPPTWAVLQNKYDPMSGLPFVDVQLANGALAGGQMNVAEAPIPRSQSKIDDASSVPQALEAKVTPYLCHEGMEYQLEEPPSVAQKRISFETGLCRTTAS